MGNKKKGAIIFVFLGIILLFVSFLLIVFGNDSKDNNNDDLLDEPTTDKNVEDDNEDKKLLWDGIYKNGDNTIYLYQLSNGVLTFRIKFADLTVNGNANIQDNIAVGGMVNVYTFKLEEEKILLSSNDSKIENSNFIKIDEYNKEDYYNDNYGELKYLETTFNGIFENDDDVITIYQINNDTVSFSLENVSKDYYISGMKFKLNDGKLVNVKDEFNNSLNITITVEGDMLIMESSSTEESNIFNKLSGNYKKTKDLTIDLIIDSN